MNLETISIDQINPAKYNPRRALQPGDPEYEKLKKSITEFDIVEPLIINKRGNVLIGGHQRLTVLKDMGRTVVDVSIVDLPEAKEKALNLALNKTGGQWYMPMLKDLLQELDTGEFDMAITGFDEDEIEELMTQVHADEKDLKEAIVSEQEYDEAADRADRILRRMTEKIKDISTRNPRALNGAIAVIVDAAKGNQILFLADPKLNDLITEIRRHAEDGTASPMELILYETINRNNK